MSLKASISIQKLNFSVMEIIQTRKNLEVVALTTDSKITMGRVRVVGPRIEVGEAKALADAGEAVI